jgi:hypothetical protein
LKWGIKNKSVTPRVRKPRLNDSVDKWKKNVMRANVVSINPLSKKKLSKIQRPLYLLTSKSVHWAVMASHKNRRDRRAKILIEQLSNAFEFIHEASLFL